MRKLIVWSLILSVLCMGSALAKDVTERTLVTTASHGRVEDMIGIQRGTELVVGSVTQLSGHFATDLFGNNTADMDVRALLHGYSTVVWTTSMGLALDGTAVASVGTNVNADGSATYTITLREDLAYNDGTPITATDYVFSLLLCGAPEIRQIGGTPLGLGHLVGYDEYQSGETRFISGVRLLSDHAFSMTIGAQYAQYFYGLALLDVAPYPMAIIAPGCDVFDDGDGVYIGPSGQQADGTSAYTPGEFSAQMLRATMLDPQTGYVFYPRVTSGPYQLVSYDPELREAAFVINENYNGNFEGQRPHIERIIFRQVANETMLGELETGAVGLLNKVLNASTVNEGAAMAVENDMLSASTYPRSGFAFLAFDCGQGVTASQAVRVAIAQCIKQDELVREMVGNTGLPVYGYYGFGQWMAWYVAEADPGLGLGAVDAPVALEALKRPQDLDAARKLLEGDGWTLNAQGGGFAGGVDEIRHREQDGELTPLVIRWAKTQDSAAADAIERALRESFAAVGIGLEVTQLPFNDVLSSYYHQNERDFDMFFLSNNFNYTFDPYYDFSTADAYSGSVNMSGLRDDELMRLALDMRTTSPTDLHGYAVKWLAFQRRFVEMMPMVPLYSNVYYDFFRADLQDYNIGQYPGWALAIPYAWIGEPEASEDLPAGDQGDLVFLD